MASTTVFTARISEVAGVLHARSQLPLLGTLQAFRGVAAGLVVMFHVTAICADRFRIPVANGIFAFGYTGVDFFFVLSGFIIFLAHAEDIGVAGKLRPYLLKRVLRIFPLYWLMTLLKIMVVVGFPNLRQDHDTSPATVVASLLLLPQDHLPIIGAAWTLSHEMLFYLGFALAIGLTVRGTTAALMLGAWAAVIMVVGPAARPNHHVIAFLLNERNLEFLLGCLAAFLVTQYRMPFGRTVASCGATLFLLAGLSVWKGHQVPSHTVYFGVPAFLLILGAATHDLAHPVRVPRIMLLLGAASYSIYLTHAMFIDAALLIIHRLRPGLMSERTGLPVVLSLCAILGATGVYLLFERPVHRWLRQRVVTE